MNSERIVVLPMALIEGIHLAQIVEDFLDLVKGRDAADPAVRRLTPSAYPDDLSAAASFADSTRDDLLDRRLGDAATVRQALAPFDADAEALTEDEALASRDLAIAIDDLDAWLRTLTAIRLVIAERLGIASEDDEADDGRRDVYDWLGYRLEVLIQAADHFDARP
ncbi:MULTISPECIES: DUF2017 domain-containing protein [unclassified Microbacterium]|uniref:DUF2017 domain-containing protein n=1 Tax=unclassified Microbacterium TaxID=2609290 RepID=UPI00217DB6E1|nr:MULTISPECIES: DUF2017 domain-containing protein [unclassified Microbacterium]